MSASKRTVLATASAVLIAALAVAGTAAGRSGKRDREPPSTPTNLRVTAATPFSVAFAWDAATDNVGVTGYYVHVADVNVDWRRTRVTTTAYTATGLQCGASVDIWIVALDRSGNRSSPVSATVPTAACPDLEAPTAPAGFRQQATTQDAVVLAWDSSTDNVGVVGYGVYRDALPVQSTSDPNVTLRGLSCDSAYQYQVDALDAAGNRSARRSAWVQTAACDDGEPPTAPTGLSITSRTADSLSLSWSPSSDNVGVAGYRVSLVGAAVMAVTETSATLTNLACGTSYTVALDAFDEAGNRSPTATIGAATDACASPPPPPLPGPGDTTPPSQPTGLAVTASTQTSVSLIWTASTDNTGVVGYRVYRNGTSVSTTIQPGATISSLTCGTAYTFEVDAYDAASNRSSRAALTSSTSACPDTQPPTAPTNVTASSRTATSIALSWSPSNDNVGVTSYGVYRGATQVGTSTGTTGIFSGLTCNTNYTLAVDASDAAGNRSSKTTVMVSTTACPDSTPPSTPTGLAASSITQTGLTLTWNASSDNVGVTGYDVYRNGTKMASVTSTSSSQSGLACGTSLTLGVEAFDAAGNRSPRSTLSTSTSACAPPPPPPAKQCADSLDNDGDGKVDLADPGCASSDDDTEAGDPPPPTERTFTWGFDAPHCANDVWATSSWLSNPCSDPSWYTQGIYYSVTDPDRSGRVLSQDASGPDSTGTWQAWLHDPLSVNGTTWGSEHRVDVDVKLVRWGSQASSMCSWAGGPKIFMGRPQDIYETSTYTIELAICDGSVHIQKKSWGVDDCGSDPRAVDCGAGGTWYLLDKATPGVPSFGTWHRFTAIKRDNPDGSVTLIGIRDGVELLRYTEVPNDISLGPLRGGREGWRSNAVDWRIDNYAVTVK